MYVRRTRRTRIIWEFGVDASQAGKKIALVVLLVVRESCCGPLVPLPQVSQSRIE
jgi:hypothetical protein